ncbi:hypothetical protein SEA_UPYO_62 [Gordonia phage Upyo]|nr:hypothetical protein SEA_UPYO_62 [Gordonia phage Upyo]
MPGRPRRLPACAVHDGVNMCVLAKGHDGPHADMDGNKWRGVSRSMDATKSALTKLRVRRNTLSNAAQILRMERDDALAASVEKVAARINQQIDQMIDEMENTR